MPVKRVVAVLGVAVVFGAFGALGLSDGAAAQPTATVSKACSAYAEEHFHDKTARTPGGVKCLGAGEYCSHNPGYARAYRKAGFRCNSAGRLEDS